MVHKTIEDIISPFEKIIGAHYTAYKNHVHRIVNLSLALKNSTQENDELKIIIAAVFHDIGIWTNKTFDYLDPSVQYAKEYLKQQNKTEWAEEIILMIDMHHKLSEYRGAFVDNVESFRKADLIASKFLKNLRRHPLNPFPMFKM